MELSEQKIIEKYAKECNPCLRITFLPHEYEYTCFTCGYNEKKRKSDLSKKSPNEKFI